MFHCAEYDESGEYRFKYENILKFQRFKGKEELLRKLLSPKRRYSVSQVLKKIELYEKAERKEAIKYDE